MWKKIASESGGPVLELGCGTGRVLYALGETNLSLTGIDISAAALRKARKRTFSSTTALYQADMRKFDLQTKNFALILLVHSTFLHNLTMDDQLRCLESCYQHLGPRGQLAIDILMPSRSVGNEENEKTFHLGREFVDGEDTIQWYLGTTTDFIEQRIDCTQYLDRIDGQGILHRSVIRFPLRFIYRFEMDALLRLSGFAIEKIYGDYDHSPLQPRSPKMIFIARKHS